MPARQYTAAEVDAAVQQISDPERIRHAQEIVAHLAPQLQHILGIALDEGGYFGNAHEAEVQRATGVEDPAERERAMHTLIAEEARLGMLVGVAIGFELAHELTSTQEA